MAVEDAPSVDSVGTGGIPNLDGISELDASIMVGNTFSAGGVSNLVRTRNPISVARKVMELTPHVIFAGDGATKFARSCGFPDYEPVTAGAMEKWKKLREVLLHTKDEQQATAEFTDIMGWRSDVGSLMRSLKLLTDRGTIMFHDTAGVLALNESNIVGGTSTSGWPIRLPGRVSDSSVIGAGLYATPSAAATASGQGEFAIKHTLSRKVCDFIEPCMKPKDACEEALLMVLRKEKVDAILTVIAMDRKGNIVDATTKESFSYCYRKEYDYKISEVYPDPVRLK